MILGDPRPHSPLPGLGGLNAVNHFFRLRGGAERSDPMGQWMFGERRLGGIAGRLSLRGRLSMLDTFFGEA